MEFYLLPVRHSRSLEALSFCLPPGKPPEDAHPLPPLV